MAKKTAPVPLIKRPLDEILKVAHDAGREAFASPQMADKTWYETVSDWIETNLPRSPGLADDEFTRLRESAHEAFDSAVIEFETDVEDFNGFNADSLAGVAAALDRLEDWRVRDLPASDVAVQLRTYIDASNTDYGSGFCDFIATHLMDCFKAQREEYDALDALEAIHMKAAASFTEERKTVAGILNDVIGMFRAIGRLQRQAEPTQRDLEIATLASVGVELGDSARFILGGPAYGTGSSDEAITVMHENRREHENA